MEKSMVLFYLTALWNYAAGFAGAFTSPSLSSLLPPTETVMIEAVTAVPAVEWYLCLTLDRS